MRGKYTKTMTYFKVLGFLDLKPKIVPYKLLFDWQSCLFYNLVIFESVKVALPNLENDKRQQWVKFIDLKKGIIVVLKVFYLTFK